MGAGIHRVAPGVVWPTLHPSARLALAATQTEGKGVPQHTSVGMMGSSPTQPSDMPGHTGDGGNTLLLSPMGISPEQRDSVFQMVHDAFSSAEVASSLADTATQDALALQAQILALGQKVSDMAILRQPNQRDMPLPTVPLGRAQRQHLVRPLWCPQPTMLTVARSENPLLQHIHDAIYQAKAASSTASQAAQNVEFLEAQVTALVYRLADLEALCHPFIMNFKY